MNPIANTGVFLGLTSDDDAAVRRAVALRATLTCFIIVAVFMAAGKVIFSVFGITLPAFRITGGILVFVIGYHMLHGESSPVHDPGAGGGAGSREAALDVAISPLAVPILAGPGTIAAAMSFVGDAGPAPIAITAGAFAALCLLTYICFVFGERLIGAIGESGVKIVTRLMGLILAVVGVQMAIGGVLGVVAAQ
jgi:multiple antibiotic resistance protein